MPNNHISQNFRLLLGLEVSILGGIPHKTWGGGSKLLTWSWVLLEGLLREVPSANTGELFADGR